MWSMIWQFQGRSMNLLPADLGTTPPPITPFLITTDPFGIDLIGIDPTGINLTIVHHQIFLDGVPNPYEIQRTNYEQDRGDCYKAAWKRERQLAKQYHADADAYDELYHEERYRRHAENRKARRAQRDHYLQGYEDGWGYSQEIGGRAVRKQARQYEKTRREDYQRYDQGVYDAYEYGRQPGQQRGRSKKKTPRPASPNNHSHRVTYQDRQSNDAAYRHRGQWHGYAETEYDD
ncbi:hypothetical protein MMC07_002468 [Pseudocyphellaria aurata]|nr:hypothetical protein [Pseudocyphellaria aurata]